MWLNLSRLWRYLFLLAGALVIFTSLCTNRFEPRSQHAGPANAPPAKQQETRADSAAHHPPTYTYVGEVERPAPKNHGGEKRATTEAAIQRQTQVDTTLGVIPDLDINLNGNSTQRLMTHYGYVPAMKTKTRLLGKIVDDTFTPLTTEEIANFANRGRSGESFAGADEWRSRVARELNLPVEAVHCIFLVPHRTEQFFIAAQKQAIAATGRQAEEVALTRGHFDADLTLVVNAVITKSGETIPVDSLRYRFLP
jgi:hypothetical protein